VSSPRDVVFGLAAAGGFGTADFIARQVTHRIGFLAALFFLQALGSLGLSPLAFIYERVLWQAGDPWLLIGMLGFLNLFAALALYRAFEHGALSVVAPLISMSPAITTVLALVVLGERPGGRALAGIALVLAGIVALSRSGSLVSGPAPRNPRVGLRSAFVALAGFGVLGFALKYAVDAVGPMTTIVAVRMIGVVAILLAALAGLVRLPAPPRGAWRGITAMTVIDTSAFVAFTTGIGGGSVAIVSTLSGLFSAVTVGLAAWLLRERLRPSGYASIAVMLTGVALIAAR
jgi:drug/metabolite transporter (DMT)-like permease